MYSEIKRLHWWAVELSNFHCLELKKSSAIVLVRWMNGTSLSILVDLCMEIFVELVTCVWNSIGIDTFAFVVPNMSRGHKIEYNWIRLTVR